MKEDTLMKRFDIRKLWAALALALILCLAVPALLPVRVAPAFDAQAAAKVKLSKTKATLYVGQTLQLKLNNAKGTVTWKSGKTSVATVSKKGKVTAKKKGTATITAVSGKKKYTCKITVKPGLVMSSVSLQVPAQGKATFKLKQLVDGKVTAVSNDDNVAYATVKGGKKKGEKTLTVYGEEKGSAVITLKNAATKETLKLKVTVSKPKATPTPTPTATPAPNQYFVLEDENDKNVTAYYNPIAVLHPPFNVGVYLHSDKPQSATIKVADTSIVECEWDEDNWDEWSLFGKEDYNVLRIYPYKAGTTTITLSNNVNSETIKIKVTVVSNTSFYGY